MMQDRQRLRQVLRKVKSAMSRDAAVKQLTTPAIVFAPHQDDETLGCGGTIAKKSAAGARIEIVFMTDGVTSHDAFVAPATLNALRKQEATDAALVLGVPRERLKFLELPNNGLDKNVATAVARVRKILACYPSMTEIYIPHRAEPPRDHWLTNYIVRSALKDGGTGPILVREYPVWMWHHWPWTDGKSAGVLTIRRNARLLAYLFLSCTTRESITNHVAHKRSALNCYRTQMQRPAGITDWPVLADVSDGDFLGCFDQEAEYFYQYRYNP